MDRINYELKKVENGPVGKLFRTLGYLIILAAALFFAANNLAILDFKFLNNIVEPVLKFFNQELKVLMDYWSLFLIGGIMILIWPLSKKITQPIIVTILIVIATLIDNLVKGKNGILGIEPLFNLEFLTNAFLNNEWLILVVYLIPLLFVYVLIGKKKPKRIATSLLSGALLILFFALIADYLPNILQNDWATNEIFIKVISGVSGFSFLLQALASVFGVLGFLRK